MDNTNELLKKITFFSESDFKEELLQHGKLVNFKKGDIIVRDGQYVKFLPIVIKGALEFFSRRMTEKYCFIMSEPEKPAPCRSQRLILITKARLMVL